MPTVDDILNRLTDLGVNSQETPDSLMEKQAAELGLIDNEQTIEGEPMQLKDFYDNHFGGVVDTPLTKEAAYEADEYETEEEMSKVASEQYDLGSMVRDNFDYMLDERLDQFELIKEGMEDAATPEAAATVAAGAGEGAVAGPSGSPELAVNKPSDADEAIDTDPTYYDLGPEMDSAVEKARLESALADGSEKEIEGTHNTPSGIGMPSSQATA